MHDRDVLSDWHFLRVGVWLLAVQMTGGMSPLFLYPSELFPGPLHASSLEAQYIIKDLILIAAGMVIASTWTRIVARPQSFKSTLARRGPGISRDPTSIPNVRKSFQA